MPFPLLAKDLTESAARRRTYVVRCLFGVLVAIVFWRYMGKHEAETAEQSGLGGTELGVGRALFSILAQWVCWAVLLVQPMLMAPALTQEKERGTLELLLLAPMRVWSLLVQKF